MRPKKASIIIPCYNDGKYLAEALASARAQTYPDIEIIIVDDYSTDAATKELLARLSSEGHRVLQTAPGKKGLSAARNTGIAAASGEYILPLDADDKIDATYVAKAVAVLEANPDVVVCGSQSRFFGLRNKEWVQPECNYRNLVTEEYKLVCASLYRRKDWERVGGYEESLTLGKEDMVFWLDLLRDGGRVTILPEILFFYRVRPHSMTALIAKGPTEDEKLAALYAARPEIFRDYVLDYMCLLGRCRFEKSWLVCLFSWKALRHVFALEWALRQFVKKFFGRA